MRKPVVTGQCRPQAEPKPHVPAPCMRSKQLGYGFDLLAQYSERPRGRCSRKQQHRGFRNDLGTSYFDFLIVRV